MPLILFFKIISIGTKCIIVTAFTKSQDINLVVSLVSSEIRGLTVAFAVQ